MATTNPPPRTTTKERWTDIGRKKNWCHRKPNLSVKNSFKIFECFPAAFDRTHSGGKFVDYETTMMMMMMTVVTSGPP